MSFDRADRRSVGRRRRLGTVGDGLPRAKRAATTAGRSWKARSRSGPKAKRGPTPILPPALDLPHTEAASITGGYVYRGKRLPELAGAYICGDWVTRKVWGTRFDGDKIVWHRELAHGSQRIVAFGEDARRRTLHRPSRRARLHPSPGAERVVQSRQGGRLSPQAE